MRATRGLCYLHAFAICLGLTVVVAGCSSDADGPSEPTTDEIGGVAGDATSSGGAENTNPGGAGGARTSRAGAAARGGSTQSTMVTFGGSAQTTPASCPTFADDFIPQINAPVCSMCHMGGGRTPDWSSYSQVKANCSVIGSRVASGAMPPPRSGYVLTAAQKTLVADFVSAGCPQTKSDCN